MLNEFNDRYPVWEDTCDRPVKGRPPETIHAVDPFYATQLGPKHYTNKGIQPWDAMKSWLTKNEFRGYLRGNVIKYIARYADKGGVEDLNKAQHYLSKLIEEEKYGSIAGTVTCD